MLQLKSPLRAASYSEPQLCPVCAPFPVTCLSAPSDWFPLLQVASYAEASRARIEVLDVATEAYNNLIQSQVADYKTLWVPTHQR